MKARVTVTLKSGVLDPQGQAIGGSLKSLGFAGVASVRQGKVFDIEMGDTDPITAREILTAMCDRLLANTVIENYAIDVASAVAASGVWPPPVASEAARQEADRVADEPEAAEAGMAEPPPGATPQVEAEPPPAGMADPPAEIAAAEEPQFAEALVGDQAPAAEALAPEVADPLAEPVGTWTTEDAAPSPLDEGPPQDVGLPEPVPESVEPDPAQDPDSEKEWGLPPLVWPGEQLAETPVQPEPPPVATTTPPPAPADAAPGATEKPQSGGIGEISE